MKRKKKHSDDLTVNEVPVYGEDPKPKKEKIDILDLTTPKAVKNPPKDRKGRNREMVKSSYVIVVLFLSLCGYLVYFNIIKAPQVNANSYNSKQDAKESMVIRGGIYTDDGQMIAGTNVDAGGNESRVYPYGQVFSHVTGYATNGKSGMEAEYNSELLTSNSSILQQLESNSEQEKVRADNLYTTFNSSLQRAAYDALSATGLNGAVVVLEPDTGKILAMVSLPGFDPNTISQDWDYLVSSENSPLLNRAAQGLYPPGSTFKILTTLAYIRENPDTYQNFSFDCQGVVTIGDVSITCYGGQMHGQETLEEAFMHSCNGAFATIGTELKYSPYKEICQDFFFNDSIDFAMDTAKSSFALQENSSVGDQMTTAIGQGDTLATPLQMALIASAVANGGTIMKPYYLDHISTYDGDLVKQYKSSAYRTVMSSDEAAVLAQFMTRTGVEGTAAALSGNGYTVAGKTGSAEYDLDDSGDSLGTHSWFVGYSNVEDPDIAVAVIVENGGSGSSTAVPLAKTVFDAYYYGY